MPSLLALPSLVSLLGAGLVLVLELAFQENAFDEAFTPSLDGCALLSRLSCLTKPPEEASVPSLDCCLSDALAGTLLLLLRWPFQEKALEEASLPSLEPCALERLRGGLLLLAELCSLEGALEEASLLSLESALALDA